MGPTITGEEVDVIALLRLPHVPYMNSRGCCSQFFFARSDSLLSSAAESRNDGGKRFTSTLLERGCFIVCVCCFLWPLILPLGLLPMEDDVINPSMF